MYISSVTIIVIFTVLNSKSVYEPNHTEILNQMLKCLLFTFFKVHRNCNIPLYVFSFSLSFGIQSYPKPLDERGCNLFRYIRYDKLFTVVIFNMILIRNQTIDSSNEHYKKKMEERFFLIAFFVHMYQNNFFNKLLLHNYYQR